MTQVLVPKPPRPTSADKPTRVLFRPTPGLIEDIDDAAGVLGLSRNEAMNQLLRFAIDEHNKKPKKK